jgi:glycosyltransferase involved in cell wall biosynthesis
VNVRKVSAYVPCYNDAAYLPRAVASLRAQTVPPDEIIVIDDGSSDESRAVAESSGARVVVMAEQSGRGAARARAMVEARHEFVLCCDARIVLAPDFLQRGLPRFDDNRVGAVFGRSVPPEAKSAVDRWGARHLLRTHLPAAEIRRALLETGGAIVRRSTVMSVGNFDSRLRHSEDLELGRRLLAAEYDVVRDPMLRAHITAHHSLREMLERYWRWNAGPEERLSFGGYLRRSWHAVKFMAREDVIARDFAAVPITLLAPHYEFWLGLKAKRRRWHARRVVHSH